MDYINRLKIKTSDTQEMKLVFTAQSKQFFYCRDVICEYVMKQGYLPINPFRVFDYFLNDRVDRDLVRRGNNQLIRTCDELWVFGNIADGVLFEIVSAIEQKKPVKFFTISSEINEIREIPVDDITFEPQVHAAKIKKHDIIDFIKTGDVKETDDLSGQMSIFDFQQNGHFYNGQFTGNIEATRDSEIKQYDAVVIGLGPAGMMALKYLADSSFCVLGIDMGKNPYKRENISLDIPRGFGGAGLFSDGKLSFYPSGSKMWNGLPSEMLKMSYNIIKADVGEGGCVIPEWNDEWEKEYIPSIGNKKYSSIYFSRNQSDQFIRSIYDKYNNYIIVDTKVTGIYKNSKGYKLEISKSENHTIYAKNIIIATGKFGNYLLKNVGEDIRYKTKYEVGIRLETASENFIPNDYDQVDYKLIERIDSDCEVRTFCCCKDGVVLESFYEGYPINHDNLLLKDLRSYNGSITDYRTARSNIGITIRTESKESCYTKEFKDALKNNSSKIMTLYEIDKILERGDNIIGIKTDKIIRDFINNIIRYDKKEYDTKIYWPEVEYFGRYPVFDWNTLRIPDSNIWIAGDATGEFRGLIPSMISGTFAAINIQQEMG